ncbi:MAG: tRNA lysidine(34) synthetase TilS [Anaerolineaceae bacterium]|nr:tRNA lysidine(34) synthetase TilS [Anaerolineaceae bacterium]
MLIDRIAKNLKEKCGVKIQEKVVLGFSGGADSICLLDILHQLGYRVVVAYFNHQLRASVDEEVRFVKNVVNKYGYGFKLGAEDINTLAEKTNRGIEETARSFRYQFLVKIAQDTGSSSILVAHHADDQVETILMNLIRGTGLNGLVGMDYLSYSEFSNSIPIIRPLLNVWKDEIISYCEKNNLTFAVDETNLEVVFTRNSIRRRLIPFLEKYNPSFKRGLIRMSGILHDDYLFIKEYSEKIIENVIRLQKPKYVEINLQVIKKSPISVQRYIISGLLQNNFNIGKRKSFNLIENIRKALVGEITSHYSRLLKDLYIIVEKDLGYLFSNIGDIKNKSRLNLENDMVEVAIPGFTSINQKWRLKSLLSSMDEVREIFRNNKNSYFAYLDAEISAEKVFMRKWQVGDRYAPLGLSGHSMKLSDFWINKGFPKRFRADWPLIISNKQLIWIPGFQPAYHARITEFTKYVLQLSVEEV